MTDTEVDLETQASRIAARGREALTERLRRAYGDAAAAHADLISLDEGRIETMVQAAVDTADGLQWRRALARVASDELGLSVAEALSHPAVTRAQQLVGAPSYEQSLAELIARPVPPPIPVATSGGGEAVAIREPVVTAPEAGPEPDVPAKPEPEVPAAPAEPEPEVPAAPAEPEPEADEHETSDELESVEADDVVLELLPEPEPIEYETEAYDVEASFAQEPVPPAPVNPFATQTPHEAAAAQEEETAPATQEQETESAAPATQEHETESAAPTASEQETELVIPAIHLGGVANLPTKREGLSVRLSQDGLDIMRGPDDIIGRLVWDEIEMLEVPHLRARRRGKQVRARLIVRTPHGDASFEVPEISADELRDRVEPFMRLYIRQ